MNRYDPEKSPDPEVWLAIDEAERIDLIERYHRDKKIKLPKVRAHAAIHAIVENQLAMPDQEIVRQTLARLMQEGLSRHDALHAIGTTLMCHLNDLLQEGKVDDPTHAAYYRELNEMTAAKWRNSGQ